MLHCRPLRPDLDNASEGSSPISTARESGAILSAVNVSHRFARAARDAVSGLTLEVHAGEFVAIIGPSGCGKSTLLSILAGLVEPDGGEVLLEGARQGRLGRIGYMQQKDLLMPWRTVMENARLGLELRGEGRAESEAKVRRCAETCRVQDVLERRPWELSGGMRQRVSLMRTMVMEPRLLLLDEPFSALDAITRQALQEWLAATLRQEGMTAVLVTHDIDEALKLAGRVLVMPAGGGGFADEIRVEGGEARRAELRKRLSQMLAAGAEAGCAANG